MNIQHSSRSDLWYTPESVIALVKAVLGPIDLDPASDNAANQRVGATRIITRQQDGLTADWGTVRSVYLNPPGGKRGNKSLTRLFWEKLCAQRPCFGHAVFMAFSAEALQTTQKSPMSIMSFPFCVPSARIKFDYMGGSGKVQPAHSNVVVYVPGHLDCSDKFRDVFSALGACK